MPRGTPNRVQTPGEVSQPGDTPTDAKPATAGMSPEMAAAVQAEVARQLAAAAAPKPQKAKAKPLTMEEAIAAAAAMVAAGRRPRPLLTEPQGWYCHPEMGREKQMGSKE